MTKPPSEHRLRKAWEVRVRGYDEAATIFAPTAGKARMDAWRSLSDCGTIALIDIRVRRAPSRDVLLPVRDPLADLLSDDERHCLLHAFGGNADPLKAGYRCHFYTRRDDPPLVSLTNHGLMTPTECGQDEFIYFLLTEMGKRVALSLVPEYRSR